MHKVGAYVSDILLEQIDRRTPPWPAEIWCACGQVRHGGGQRVNQRGGDHVADSACAGYGAAATPCEAPCGGVVTPACND